jgi:hypothetical protein
VNAHIAFGIRLAASNWRFGSFGISDDIVPGILLIKKKTRNNDVRIKQTSSFLVISIPFFTTIKAVEVYSCKSRYLETMISCYQSLSQ